MPTACRSFGYEIHIRPGHAQIISKLNPCTFPIHRLTAHRVPQTLNTTGTTMSGVVGQCYSLIQIVECHAQRNVG